MRIVNRSNNPYCAQRIRTWSRNADTRPTITQDGERWTYQMPKGSSLIPNTMGCKCVMMELTPPEAWDNLNLERGSVILASDGLHVMDCTKESRANIGLMARDAVTVTPTGMCFIELDEWPILREAGATIFAADTAPY